MREQPIEAPAKVNAANADLILGFDILGVTSPDNLNAARAGHTVAVINTDLMPTIDVIRNRLPIAGAAGMLDGLHASTNAEENIYVDANRLAEGLFGSHMAVNIFMTGIAWQAGLIPISLESIEQAIEMNGVEKERNLRVFRWGRKWYQDPAFVESQVSPRATAEPQSYSRVDELRAYQNDAYAHEYERFISRIGDAKLRGTVGQYLYKLMAYKDEYEIARLLTKPEFEQTVRDMWEAPESLSYNLHPPLLRRFGLKKKMKLGAWFRYPLVALARLKFLRGTPFDFFGYSAHRRKERELIGWYRSLVEAVLERLTPENLDDALELAALPDQIRGYEHIKEDSIARVKKLAEEKLGSMARQPLTYVP